MTQMLELERQLLVELVDLSLSAQVFDGGFDETLGDLERGLDLDPGCGARIKNGHDPRDDHGKKIDRPDRHEKLRSDRPVIPKLLQHDSKSPWRQILRGRGCGHGASIKARHASFLRTSPVFRLSPAAYRSSATSLCRDAPCPCQCTPGPAQRQWQAWQYDCQIFPTTIGRVIRDGHGGKALT